jgi:hypothetical protein
MNDEYADWKAITKGKGKRETSHPDREHLALAVPLCKENAIARNYALASTPNISRPAPAASSKDNPGLSWK